MDGLKVVTLSAGGRPVVQADVLDGTTYNHLRGTFKVAPGQKRQQVSQQQSRYGGGRIVGDSQENATIGGTWLIAGATADLVNANTEALLALVDAASAGRLLEWTPDGSTRPVYEEIRGPGTYTPTYEWVEYQGAQVMKVDLVWPVAPLPLLLPMDIGDDFSVNSIADYTFDQGAGTLSVVGGQLVPSDVTTKRFYHSARGHAIGDVEVTWKFTTGASVAATHRTDVTLKGLGPNDYLMVGIADAAFELTKTDGGVNSNLVAGNAIVLATATTYWLRVRIEGNILTVELWTAAPTPMGAPTSTQAFTLAGADATKFGFGVVGYVGARFIPKGVDWRYDDLQVRPFTYRNRTLPELLQLSGAIPGRAPALCDVEITPSGGAAAPIWALIAWAKRAGAPLASSVVPFGIIEAETAGDLAGWAVNADAGYRGGNRLRWVTAGAGAATASWLVDPSTLVADDFTQGEIDIEVWGVVGLDAGLVSPKLTLSVRPEDGTSFGAERFTAEWGSAGRLLTKPSGGERRRVVRLGTLTMAVNPGAPRRWKLWLAGSVAAGSANNFSVDYLFPVSIRARALGPTSEPNDASYPKFVASTAQTTKRIDADLSALVAAPPANGHPDHGLGGSLIEIPTGAVDMLVKLSSLVPDDPTSDATSEQLAHSATVHFAVWPRVRMLNG